MLTIVVNGWLGGVQFHVHADDIRITNDITNWHNSSSCPSFNRFGVHHSQCILAPSVTRSVTLSHRVTYDWSRGCSLLILPSGFITGTHCYGGPWLWWAVTTYICAMRVAVLKDMNCCHCEGTSRKARHASFRTKMMKHEGHQKGLWLQALPSAQNLSSPANTINNAKRQNSYLQIYR